jgi:hypothetical protein
VLWVLLLVSALAATTSYISRTNALMVRRSFELAQAQAAADAAILNTLSSLSDEQLSRHNPTDGSVRSWQFNGVDIAISVTNEATRIDLNTGEDDLIFAFLRSREITEDESHALLRSLRQWQLASDPLVGTQPSPSASVATLGGSNIKHPLLSIDELAQIPPWKNQPLDCWSDAFTVYTGSTRVNSVDASALDLAALKWADEHHLGAKVWIQAAPVLGLTSRPSSLSGEILRIVAQAKFGDATGVKVEWVGRLTGNSNNPALTMRWSSRTQDHSGACDRGRRSDS